VSGERAGATDWSGLTAQEVGAAAQTGCVAVLPVGATEQHGPHLATGTDAILAEHGARAACARTGDIVLPTLAVGCSLGHTEAWPGTLSLTPATMLQVVLEIGRWVHASGFRKLLMLNAHATNGPPCQGALLQLRYEFPDLRMRFVSMFDLTAAIAARYREDADDFHANEAETSLMLHLHPEGVRADRAVDEIDRTEGRVWQYAMPAVSRSGVVGTPTGADARRGRELFASVVDALVDLLEQARSEPLELLE
jgi:creatinine amidohydrolase